jgi:hypothetical protein
MGVKTVAFLIESNNLFELRKHLELGTNMQQGNVAVWHTITPLFSYQSAEFPLVQMVETRTEISILHSAVASVLYWS